MRRLLLTVCAILAATIPDLGLAQTQTPSPSEMPSPTQTPNPTQAPGADQAPATAIPSLPLAPPAARLIKPRANKGDPHPLERPRSHLAPIDERCKPLKQQLEAELVHSGNPRKAFQARVAHNAGTRLCRDGQVEKGMAELRKGLSYLEVTPQAQP